MVVMLRFRLEMGILSLRRNIRHMLLESHIQFSSTAQILTISRVQAGL